MEELKYDRQVRLWSIKGQQRLAHAKILLVNNGDSWSAGVEAVKNLVLAGIGHFTILDPHTVNQIDIDSTYFLDDQCIGHSRARELCTSLSRLNDDVTGDFLEQSLEDFLNQNAQHPSGKHTLQDYSIIIANYATSASLTQLIKTSWTTSTHLTLVQTMGFNARISIQYPEYHSLILSASQTILSPHDLRLTRPWPKLINLCRDICLNLPYHLAHHVEPKECQYLPYIAILLHYLEHWKSLGNLCPTTNTEKIKFQKYLHDLGITKNRRDIEIAISRYLVPLELTATQHAIFNIARYKTQIINQHTTSFWLMVRAICDFYEQYNLLPLSGQLPDMTGNPDLCSRITQEYAEEAERNTLEIACLVAELESGANRDKPVALTDIKEFCQNFQYIRIINGQRLPTQVDWTKWNWNINADTAVRLLINDSVFSVHTAFLICEGIACGNITEQELQTYTREVLQNMINQAKYPIEQAQNEIAVQCITRCIFQMQQDISNKLYSISALAGGILAQEVTKIITGQFLSIERTCVFDGIGAKTGVYAFP